MLLLRPQSGLDEGRKRRNLQRLEGRKMRAAEGKRRELPKGHRLASQRRSRPPPPRQKNRSQRHLLPPYQAKVASSTGPPFASCHQSPPPPLFPRHLQRAYSDTLRQTSCASLPEGSQRNVASRWADVLLPAGAGKLLVGSDGCPAGNDFDDTSNLASNKLIILLAALK